MSFESEIKDPAAPMAVDFNPARKVLMLAFGGFARQMGFPMFEFNNMTRELGAINRIFLRDQHTLRYHRGLPGVGENIDGIASFLRRYTAHPSTQRTITIGTSGGGYAALLFGHLPEADEVHAFNPLTFLNPIRRIPLGDVTLWKPWLTLLCDHEAQSKYFDLRKVFSLSPGINRNVYLYHSENRRSDRLHARRMRSIPGFQLYPYPSD